MGWHASWWQGTVSIHLAWRAFREKVNEELYVDLRFDVRLEVIYHRLDVGRDVVSRSILVVMCATMNNLLLRR
jgi:hypothetical protein